MSIQIRVSSTLRTHVADYNPEQGLDVDAAGKTIYELAQELGIPVSEIKFTMLNGKLSPMNTRLTNGDRLAYFPAVGGG